MKKINTQDIYVNSFGDHYFPEINSHAFDNVGANAIFNKVFNKELDIENTLFIIVGSDSGLLIPYLQSNHADKGRHYIILEKPEMIEYIEKNIEVDHQLIDILPLETDFGGFSESYTDYVSHARYQLLRSLSVIDSHNLDYQDGWDVALDKFNIFTDTESGYAINNIFIDSQLRNLSLSQIPVNSIHGTLKGLTAIIMGGGPSLDEDIGWIKDNQDKLVIFAAARISNRLKKEGICPDFFVTVDPHPVSYDNSKPMLPYGDKAILVHSNNANSKLLSEWTGNHAYLGLRYPWADSQHNQPYNLNIVGPTVTNTMASVASFLGARQIIFSGVDFCHSANGQCHESNSVESKLGKYLDVATNRVETYSGRIAETTPSFANAREGMEDLVAYATQSFDNTFYTLSQESAKIEKVAYSPATNIQLSDENKFKAMAKIKDTLKFDLESYQAFLKEAKSYCQEVRNLCKEATKVSRQGKKIAKLLFKNLSETDELTQKLIQTQKDAEYLLGEHAEFVFNYSIKAYKDFMDPSVKQDNMTRKDIKNAFMHYFSGLINSSIPLRKSIELAITRLNHRINETKGIKPLGKLIEKWQAYQEQGRPLVWMKMHNLTLEDLPAEHQPAVKALIETFHKELKETDTQLSKQLRLQGESLSNNFTRIQRYFAENRAGDLEILINYIDEKSQEGDNAEDLCNIGSGYLYELKEMPDEALSHYVKIKDSKLLLEGLKRVVNITLIQEDYDSALNALEVLVNYSDEYYIAYADISAATGNGLGAAEIYQYYLKTYDEDVATWIKLAKIQIHNGATAEAISAIKQVSKLEPENTITNELMNLATRPKS